MTKPPKDWKVSAGPEPAPLICQVINAHRIYGWLTKPQRAALLADDRSQCHGPVLRRLQCRGLLDDNNQPTPVGEIVRRWNNPRGAP